MLKWTWLWTPDDGSIAAETYVGLLDMLKKYSAFVGLIVEWHNMTFRAAIGTLQRIQNRWRLAAAFEIFPHSTSQVWNSKKTGA